MAPGLGPRVQGLGPGAWGLGPGTRPRARGPKPGAQPKARGPRPGPGALGWWHGALGQVPSAWDRRAMRGGKERRDIQYMNAQMMNKSSRRTSKVI